MLLRGAKKIYILFRDNENRMTFDFLSIINLKSMCLTIGRGTKNLCKLVIFVPFQMVYLGIISDGTNKYVYML